MAWVPGYEKEESIAEVSLASGSISTLYPPEPAKKKHPVGFVQPEPVKKLKKKAKRRT